jgi:hypothetical protein
VALDFRPDPGQVEGIQRPLIVHSDDALRVTHLDVPEGPARASRPELPATFLITGWVILAADTGITHVDGTGGRRGNGWVQLTCGGVDREVVRRRPPAAAHI